MCQSSPRDEGTVVHSTRSPPHHESEHRSRVLGSLKENGRGEGGREEEGEGEEGDREKREKRERVKREYERQDKPQ